MSNAPQWALRMVERVCADADEDTPEVTWRRSKTNVSSSGRYKEVENRIVVTAGSSRTDQRMVLLHELAHHLTPGQHHNETFWRKAWELYLRFGLSRYALRREFSYRTEAANVALAIGIRGAKAAAAPTRPRRRPPLVWHYRDRNGEWKNGSYREMMEATKSA